MAFFQQQRVCWLKYLNPKMILMESLNTMWKMFTIQNGYGHTML